MNLQHGTLKGKDRISIGLFIPYSGPMGLWAPSSERCGQLAAAELNDYWGILGREIDLRLVDASGSPCQVVAEAQQLIRAGKLDAIIGMHASDVRHALAEAVSPKIPYIYTPMYEGKENHDGVFTTGDTPERQVQPIIYWLAENCAAKKWYFIGSDYVWPRATTSFAKKCIAGLKDSQIVGEDYIPLTEQDYTPYMERIEQAKPDVVVVNLLGDCSIHFNRQFGERGLGRDILRYCGAIEENMLYAIGADNTENMFSTMSYFEDLGTEAAQSFSKYYYSSFGKSAPALNQFAASCYEGLMLLSGLSATARSIEVAELAKIRGQAVPLSGPREAVYSQEAKHFRQFTL